MAVAPRPNLAGIKKSVGIRRGRTSVSVWGLTSAVRALLCATVAVVMVLVLTIPAWAGLPDNRAYEMVSPVEKGGVSYMLDLAVSSADGEHVIVDGGPANSLLSSDASWMLENRTPTGWSGVQVGPPPRGGTEENYIEQRSTDLAGVSEDFTSIAFQMFTGLDPRDRNSPPGVHGLAYEYYNLENIPSDDVYVRRGPTESLTWVTGPPAPMEKTAAISDECFKEPTFCAENNAGFAGGSSDLSVVVWSQLKPMVTPPSSLPGSPVDTHQFGSEVYASTNGSDQRLVGLVPASGSECGPSHGSCVVPPCGAAMGNAPGKGEVYRNSFATVEGAVSGDGSQVVFTSPEPAVESEAGCHPGEIYVRENDTATAQASATQRMGGDPHGPRPKLYVGAAQEGGKIDTVFFTSSEELTNNANTGSEDQGNDLYTYSLKTGKLTDITADSSPADANGASVVAFVGSSTDGSIVYFTATGALTSEPNSQGETAQSGVNNLYVYDASTGKTHFIAPGNGIEGPRSVKTAFSAGNEGPSGPFGLSSGLTPDGRHLVFLSREHVTSYDNIGLVCGPQSEFGNREYLPGPCREVYLYDETDNRVVCVSCDLSGAPPAYNAELPREVEAGNISIQEDPFTLPRPRVVSDSGERVFFDSPDQLTADAPSPNRKFSFSITNNGPFEVNLYEYEAGHVYLIAPAAALANITPSGNDVFFYTDSQLVPQDRDGTIDIYDARVGGGFPVLAVPQCSGTSCQGVPAPAPIFAAPPSATFSGAGNFTAPVSSSVHVKKAKRHFRKKARRKRTVHGRARGSSRHSMRGNGS